MKRTSIGVLLVTVALTLLGCSDPTGPAEVVGEVTFASLSEHGGMGDGVILPDTEEVEFPGIVMEQDDKTIEVRGAIHLGCNCTPLGAVVRHGKNQLTVSIRSAGNSVLLEDPAVAFRATTFELLESGSYDVHVIYHHDEVVFTGTVVID